MPGTAAAPLVLRRAEDADRRAILELLRASLGQSVQHHDSLFRWKHEQNPFGPSPQWVATAEGAIVGFRTFMRWCFTKGDEVLHGVRAVDTATHPEHQGRGIFRQLTMLAIEELRAEGVDFVFNTPNDKSRPGYLKMGWKVAGRLPVSVHTRSGAGLVRMATARVPAGRWSIPSRAGLSVSEALAPDGVVAELLDAQPASQALMTRRTPAFLSWRYSAFEPVAYRAHLLGPRADDGLVFFRLRNRGSSIEMVLGDQVVGGTGRGRRGRHALPPRRSTGADYVVCLSSPATRERFLRVPGAGPVLTYLPLNATVTSSDKWDLKMGDVELF